MNFIFCCNEYPPSKNGGVGTVTKIVAEELTQRGHRVIVIGSYDYYYPYLNKDKRPIKTIINNVEIHNLTYNRYKRYFGLRFSRFIQLFLRKIYVEHFIIKGAIRKQEGYIKDLADKNKTDIIEFVDYNIFNKLLKFKIKYASYKQKTTFRIHGSASFIHYFKNGSINNTLLENDINYLSNADFILSTSDFSSQFLKKHLNVKSKIDKIYNPISFNKKLVKPLNLESNRLLYFGKLTKTKGIFTLIKAFNEISLKHSEFELIIIGTGEKIQVENEITPHVKSQVKFLGFVSDEELVDEIDKSYLCILPSYFENFSMAALEVLSRKRTLIYTKRASGPELIDDGENGILVNPEDHEELKNKIEKLIIDKDYNFQLAEKGYKHCMKHFSTDKIVDSLEGYYRSILANS
ncbi:glycosyltransferase family 4 protein [Saccharicrinis sp. FJH54]|uniref:glycosyltransferase family 4 protein n=1 Tax=Saccharicrinis sp. FJH54 TaxID=3344665 RepID=UPI0035D4D60B